MNGISPSRGTLSLSSPRGPACSRAESHIPTVKPRDTSRPGDHGLAARLCDGAVLHPDHSLELPPRTRLCRTCGSICLGGRWQWRPLPLGQDAARTRCPACLRTRRDDPAGIVMLTGRLVQARGEALRRLILDQAGALKQANPQSRIIRLIRRFGRIEVRTTEVNLTLRIAEAVEQAHGGILQRFRENGRLMIHVRWPNDDREPASSRCHGPEAGSGGSSRSMRLFRLGTGGRSRADPSERGT